MSGGLLSLAVVQTSEGDGGPELVEPEDEAVSRDDVFEILSSHRRRYTLHHLQHAEETVELGDLAEQVAAWENDISVSEVSATERKRVYTSLQQFHLPKMDEKDVVTFDQRAGTVTLTDRAADLDLYLEVVEGKDIPWSQYYLGLSAVNAALMAAVAIDAYPFGFLSEGALGVFVITTFALSAAVHTYLSRTEMQLGEREDPPEVRD